MRLMILMALLAAPATATEVVRLTEAQRDAVIAAAANGPEKTPVLTPEQTQRQSVLERSLYPEFYENGGGAVRDRKVHGEMSMFAGSGGTFGVSGTAVVPVGDTGTAALSVMQGTSRWGGISGFGFGYSSGDAQNNLLIGHNFGGYGGLGAFGGYGGGFGGPWTSPYGRSVQPARQQRRR
ncbi:hypothetical protein [Sandarakinorhabdus sp. AAP62]|uniref:hypothetical protein n=1 Tax=Sandarakinorhabdus sp. AAP62 TaxID=1248916 RepID=UPI00126704A4|nr:hypothetical protein [Sandarakinorhabdus sp. AAP62]